MIGKSERQSREFLEWESRGRGFHLWAHPVSPEPPFRPFLGAVTNAPPVDDGRKSTFLSGLLRQVSERLAPPPSGAPVGEDEESPSPEVFERDELIELQAHLPDGLKISGDAYEGFLKSVAACGEPVTFELIATGNKITVQYAVSEADERLFRRQLEAFFPDVSFEPTRGHLEGVWGERGKTDVAVVEFGLGKEFVISLVVGHSDPFVGLVGALSEIEDGEVAVFQVTYSPTTHPWDESMVRSVTHADGSAMFVNAPELLPGAKEKVSKQLFAAVVRVAVSAESSGRVWEIATNVAGALGAYGSRSGNELVPLRNDEYPAAEHEIDLLRRQTRRSGMLLNAKEITGFVHMPSGEVASPRLRLKVGKTKALPAELKRGRGIEIGVNLHHGVETPFVLTNEQRVRHVHVIGASGTGKSSLLFNMVRQDVESGAGITLLDPHGDLVDRVLEMIPLERVGDVVLIDPSDEEFTVGFNILSAHSDWEKNLLASDLVSVFRRNSAAWGDQMNSVLQNAILAILESDRGGTLLDLRRFLLEPAFRSEFLKSIRDENIQYYWRHGFASLSGNKSVGSIVTRLDAFLSPKPLRYMVGQKANRLDFGDIMGAGKILLAKLSQGAIGRENSHLLGSLLVAKIQSEAMSRQRESEANRRDHFLYIDEFHDFLTPSLAETLAGVRKYRLGLVLGHQELRQVEREPDVASALLSNAHTRIVFRVGDKDARTLENGFSSFEAKDMQNLATGQAICRVERSDNDFNLTVEKPEYPSREDARAGRELVVAASRKKYGTPRGEIEKMFAAAPPPVTPSESQRSEKPVVGSENFQTAEKPVVAQPAQPVATTTEPVPSAKVEAPISTPETKAIADLGRGGVQHKAIQDRIKDEAEKIGYRVTMEQEILGGVGRVDLVLVRDDVATACEVTVTTTIDHEVGNVSKCVKAGFTRIAVVAMSEEKLGKIRAAVGHSLGEEKAKLVTYHLPDAFIESLRKREVPIPAAPEPEIRSRGGRVVKRTFTALSPEEAKAREEAAHRLMAETMKKKRRT